MKLDFQQLVSDIEEKYNKLADSEVKSDQPTPGNIIKYFEFYQLATSELALNREKLANLKKYRWAIKLGMLSTLSLTVSLLAVPLILNPFLFGFTLPTYLLIGIISYGIFNKEKLPKTNSFTPLLVAPFTPFVLAYKLSGFSHNKEVQGYETKVKANGDIKKEIENWFSKNKETVLQFLGANYLNCKDQLPNTFHLEKLNSMKKQAKILLGIKELMCAISSN